MRSDHEPVRGEDQEIQKFIMSKGVNGNLSAFILGRTKALTGDVGKKFEQSLSEMKSEGPSYTNAIQYADSQRSTIGKVQPKRQKGVITWGRKIPLGDCEVQDVAIGRLHFRELDFGDTIRLSERSRVHLGNVDAHECNRCVLLHTVAGTQWAREGEKNGVPTLARVIAEAEEWRKEEYDEAHRALDASEERKDWYALEVRNVAHDAAKSGHGRDYRGFVLFFKNLFRRNNISVRVFDIRDRLEGWYVLTVNLFAEPGMDESNVMLIDLLAFKHHMRWLKLREDNLSTYIRDGKRISRII